MQGVVCLECLGFISKVVVLHLGGMVGLSVYNGRTCLSRL